MAAPPVTKLPSVSATASVRIDADRRCHGEFTAASICSTNRPDRAATFSRGPVAADPVATPASLVEVDPLGVSAVAGWAKTGTGELSPNADAGDELSAVPAPAPATGGAAADGVLAGVLAAPSGLAAAVSCESASAASCASSASSFLDASSGGNSVAAAAEEAAAALADEGAVGLLMSATAASAARSAASSEFSAAAEASAPWRGPSGGAACAAPTAGVVVSVELMSPQPLRCTERGARSGSVV